MIQKFPFLFYIILGITFLVIGLYFLKILPVFSIIFFIAMIVTTILTYLEYKYRQNEKIVPDEKTAPKDLKVKYPVSYILVNILGYCIPIIVSVFFITILNLKYEKIDNNYLITIVMAIAVIAFFIIKIIKEIKEMCCIIISINSEGIQLKNTQRIKWEEIEHEKIILKHIKSTDSRHDFRTEVSYLYFFHKNQNVEVIINDLNITGFNLAQYLKIYRHRFIEHL